ncbi:unnamed protein product [Prorocentrum cordatum]|uniref:Uncharacterized protein n=1 Tax=Prorocentrum cordatum TaxID=2364126 RepID=A0ABN9W2F2_9DINO|nr:unnamed protein product [Polarella glacialis]
MQLWESDNVTGSSPLGAVRYCMANLFAGKAPNQASPELTREELQSVVGVQEMIPFLDAKESIHPFSVPAELQRALGVGGDGCPCRLILYLVELASDVILEKTMPSRSFSVPEVSSNAPEAEFDLLRVPRGQRSTTLWTACDTWCVSAYPPTSS